MKKTVLAVALFALSAASHAENWYAGLAYSNMDVELEFSGVTAETEPTALHLVAGYKYTENFAIEAIYGAGISDDKVENAIFNFELDSIVGISAVGILPMNGIDLYAKLGYAQLDYDDSDGDTSEASGTMIGVGASFYFNEQVSFNIEYVQYPDGEYDDFNIDVEASAFNFGINYIF